MTTYPDKVIYNLDTEDFTTTYDLYGTKTPLSFTIHAKEYETFPQPVADHIAQHLANKIVVKRGVKTNYADEFELVKKEIYAEPTK